MGERTHCYAARCKGCGFICMVTTDDPEHPERAAKDVATAIRRGDAVERTPIEAFRSGKERFGCQCPRKPAAAPSLFPDDKPKQRFA